MVKRNELIKGRFEKMPDEEALTFSASHEIDRKLYSFDILGSKAHAKMLNSIGIITDLELTEINNGLSKVEEEIKKSSFIFKDSLEDIHMHIESRLAEIAKDSAMKLHTGRSRNDQVALDFKLYCRTNALYIKKLLYELMLMLLEKAKEHKDILMPAYTHLQQAQVIRASHYFLAYMNMFERDMFRIDNYMLITNTCPLGAGALAGTGLNNDRFLTAKELGFLKPTENSIDTVSDRDFALDLLYIISLIGIHLSRFCEEIVIWFSSEFSYIEIDESFCTGSSLMPQKSNPDIAELIRGKTGVFIGNLINLLITMKALPLSYNRDLQEDKKSVFDSVDTILKVLSVFTKMLSTIKIKNNVIEKQKDDYMLATDIAEYLVNKKLPFRKAHEITGKLIRYAIKNKKFLKNLTIEEFQSFSPLFENTVFDILSFYRSVDSKTTFGGTSLKEIVRQIKYYKKFLKNGLKK